MLLFTFARRGAPNPARRTAFVFAGGTHFVGFPFLFLFVCVPQFKPLRAPVCRLRCSSGCVESRPNLSMCMVCFLLLLPPFFSRSGCCWCCFFPPGWGRLGSEQEGGAACSLPALERICSGSVVQVPASLRRPPCLGCSAPT